MDYHDVLAIAGAGSAHPGGFAVTRAWAEKVGFVPEWRVLEVGCGTGRTACWLAQRFGCRVTGVDVRQAMVEKARHRAQRMGVDVVFEQNVSHRLPFAAAEFDVVVAESVTVFNPVRPLLREYARVLKPGGRLCDTEMCAAAPLPPEVRDIFRKTYGAIEVPTLSRWKSLLQEAGFSYAGALLSGSVESLYGRAEEPDLFAEPDSALPPEVARFAEENARVMGEYGRWLMYVVLLAKR